MGSSPNGNVVALGDHPRAKARLSPQETATVLGGCRDLALDRLAAALSSMLDRVEEELYTLAEGARDSEAQTVFLDARSHARARRGLIESAFRKHFAECFNRKVRGERGAAAPAGLELSLIETDELEESLAVDDMSRKLRSACEGELGALAQRMGYLLERPELEDEANPLSPSTVCAALRDACDQLEASIKVRVVLLRQLERHAAAELQRIYQDVNAHLVERRILPDVRPFVRRPAARASAEKPRNAQAPGAKPDMVKQAPAPDLFGALTQLLGAAAAPGGVTASGLPSNAPASGGSPFAGGLPGGGSTAGTPPPLAATAPVVQALTELHRTAGEVADPFVNAVREFKSGPHAANLGTVDAMTIDIVAMLFDYVFEDRHIPDSVKAQLGRLQIPVLKVALLDKSFFSSKAHPARRLIDALAEASIGLDEAHERGAATLRLVEEVVERVLADFETDLALFESLVERVQAFIAENQAAEALIVTRSANALEAAEREHTARDAAEHEVEHRISARLGVPAVVRDMLQETWVRALTATGLAGGESSGPWKYLVQGMEDLLWSVEPKASADDRKRLVAMLPTLLRAIADGFGHAKEPAERLDAFMAALVDCHAGAVKAGLKGIAPMPAVVIPPVPEAPRIERAVLPAGGVQVEQIRLKTPRGGVVRNVFTRTGIWTNVQRGTWVEFAHGEAATRARLTWISPNKGVYLFTNPAAGSAAISISPEALAEQMRLGEARLLDAAPLVDRAVDSMLANLGGRSATQAGAA